MPKVERKHRLSVARAWADTDTPEGFVLDWAETGEVASGPWDLGVLERLAQLVADAEGAWIPVASADVLEVGDGPDGHAEVILRCNREQALVWGTFLYQSIEARPLPVAPKPPEQP